MLPTRSLTFLGIEVNTVTHIASIPLGKIDSYKKDVLILANKAGCALRELKSVIGKLQLVCTVIPSGRCFLRRLHDLTRGKVKPNSHVFLPIWAKEDLLLWVKFLDIYNGRSTFNFRWQLNSSTLRFTTDSSKKGYGGIFRNQFIQGLFPESWQEFNIAILEIYPIFALVHIFGPTIPNSHLLFRCDNEAIVYVINNKTSKDPYIMKILRPLILVLMENNIIFFAQHVPGKNNDICDALSRSQVPESFLRHHKLNLAPTPIPEEILPRSFKM